MATFDDSDGSSGYRVDLTLGHVLRHAPAQSAQGRGAALIDIGQDLLLRHLADHGVLELVAFKGGTALRKVYAGAAGRFSTDLDFAVASLDDDPQTVIDLLIASIDGLNVGPFNYEIDMRRGRPQIVFHFSLGSVGDGDGLRSKLDVGPPPWLPVMFRHWVEVPIHNRYGGPLPALPVVDLAENIAEKIARLNRRSLARDAYDLVWIARTAGLPELDRSLVRRLVALKCWVDLHGMSSGHATWAAPLPEAQPFDPKRWLTARRRADFDDESIGLLTTPPPDLDDLGRELATLYRWIGDDLTFEDVQIARGSAADRGLALRMLGELRGHRLDGNVR